jgi:hypothetical protein
MANAPERNRPTQRARELARKRNLEIRMRHKNSYSDLARVLAQVLALGARNRARDLASDALSKLKERVHGFAMSRRARRDSQPQSGAASLDVTIYLADEAVHETVEIAIEDWLAVAGLDVGERDQPIIGSWFRHLKATAKQAVHSGAGQDAALTAIHAVDARLVLAQDAQITAVLLQNLGPVLASLQPTKDAVIRAGALLIVKVDWQVQVFQLTAAQQAVLDHRPQLASSPHEIAQALQIGRAVSGDEVLPSAE